MIYGGAGLDSVWMDSNDTYVDPEPANAVGAIRDVHGQDLLKLRGQHPGEIAAAGPEIQRQLSSHRQSANQSARLFRRAAWSKA